MKITRWLVVSVLLVLFAKTGVSQQLKLGNSPAAIEKSAVLELQSTNQGLLFSRIADTAVINVLNPPDGMVIYFTPMQRLLLRANGYWQPLTPTSSLSNYWAIDGNSNGAEKMLGTVDNYALPFITNNTERMRISNTGNVGIGTSSFDATNPEKLLVDAGATSSFNVISGKGSINNYLQLNIQNRSNGTTASSDIVATADNGSEAVNFVDLGMNSSGFSSSTYPMLDGANTAYLYSTGNDFVIGNGTANKNLRFFTGGYATANERIRIDGNGRTGIGVTAPTAMLHLKAGTTSASTAPLKFTSGTLMTTAEVGAVEFLTDKFYGTIATGTARKEFTLNDAALTAGRIPVVTTNGRLTNNANFVYDNTNSRLGVRAVTPTAYLHLGAGTATANTAPLKFTAGTNLTTPESGAVEFDGTHYYATIGVTRYQLDQQTGTTYTGSNGITLTGNDFRNNLITGIAGGQTVIGGTAAGNSLTLSSTSNATKGKLLFGTSAYDEANNKLGIGNSTPTEALDVTGNLKFSGALMPNNSAGTAGQLLTSNGAGAAPSWTSLGLSNLADATITSPANGQLLQYNGSAWVNSTPAYLTAVDTSNISNFYQKVRGLFSAAAPVTLTNGQIGITQASGSSDGYLSSTDWTTFNNKLSSVDTTNISNFSVKVRSLNSAAAPITYTNGQVGITQASGSSNGYLSSTDWTTFNNKLSSVDTTNISNFSVKVRGLFSAGSGITYNAATGAISSSVSTVNLWAYNGNTVTAEKTMGTIDNYALPFITNNTERMRISNSGNVGIGTASPSQKLDVNGTIVSSATTYPNYGFNTANRMAFGESNVPANETGSVVQFGSGSSSRNMIFAFTKTNVNTSFFGNDGTQMMLGSEAAAPITFRTGLSYTAANIMGSGAEVMRITTSGVGIGVTNPSNQLVVKDVAEIRRVGSLSQLIFSNTAGTGDFRIGGDGGDIFWQGGGGRALQMGSYYTTILGGDRQTTTFPAFTGGIANTGVLVQGQRDASVPLAIQVNSATQTANLTEWRNSSGTALSAVDKTGKMGLGNTSPSEVLDVTGNLKFSGAMMPGGSAGTSGYILTSNGAGAAPTWTNPSSATYWALNGNNVSSLKNFGTTSNYDLPFITNNTEQMRLSTNGDLAIGTSTFDGTAPEKLLIDAGTTTSYNLINAKGSINNYLQFNIQNESNGTAASADIVATNNNGTETSKFIDMGINSSNYSNTGILGGANNAYLYSTGSDLIIGNSTAGSSLRFFTGGTATTNERVRIDPSGNVGIGTTTPTAAMDVNGSYKLGASGTVLSNMIKTNITINDATTFTYTSTRTVTATVTGATVNGTVILNPRSALPASIGIAWARVSSANTISIGFTNTDTALKSVGSVTFDVTIIQ